MISPERLRYFPFFGNLNHKRLNQIAVITEELKVPAGTILLEDGKPADHLCFLIEGNIDLTYSTQGDYPSNKSKVLHVGDINPGEVFGVSALIEPYKYNATAQMSQDGRILRINAESLRSLLEKDPELGYIFLQEVAKAIMERLYYTRVQLAAAWV